MNPGMGALPSHTTALTLVSWNIHGLGGKRHYCESLLAGPADILVLQETWLTPGAQRAFGARCIADVRRPISHTGRQGQAGIMVLARNAHIASALMVLESDRKGRWVTLLLNRTIRICVAYFPPGDTALDRQLFDLMQRLEESAHAFEQTVLIGDLNAPHPDFNCARSEPRGTALVQHLAESLWQYEAPHEGRHSTTNNCPDMALFIGGTITPYRVWEDFVST